MIRQAIQLDERSIKECAEAAYERYVSAIGRKPAPMVADFKSQIEEGKVFIEYGYYNGLQGFIVFYPGKDHMMLENVAVFPVFSGRGIGKALIKFCEETARHQGFKTVRLYTNEKMIDNLAIYPRLGYVEIARRTEDGFGRVYFEKALA